MRPRRPPRRGTALSRQHRARRSFLPELDAIDEDLLERTVAFYLCSPSNPQGAVAPRAYLAQAIALAPAPRLSPVRRRMLFGDLWRRGAAWRARDGLRRDREPRQRRRLPVALQALGPSGFEVRLRRRRSRLHRRLRPLPQCRMPAGSASHPACLGRGVERRGARGAGQGALPREFRPGRCHSGLRATAIDGRAEPSFFGSIWPISGAARGPRQPFGKTVVSKCCRELISRERNPTGTIPGRDYVRVALVHDTDTTREALTRIVATLG